MKLVMFGAGLIGGKRGAQLDGHECVGVFDPERGKAEKLARELKARVWDSDEDMLKKSGAKLAVIATPNSSLYPMAAKAIEAGMHVLVEKPGGISIFELEKLHHLSEQYKVAVKIGFNHRFHPGMLKARELVDAGALGELMFLRARYGHGGRLGMEKEWRFQPEISGGGELLDQGVHLLDLIHWFLGPLKLKSSYVTTSFWDTPVDDNAVLTLADDKRWATFHVSCSEWKNLFSFELYGRTGKILIEGLGGSYGKEKLTYYRMLPQMGPPEIETFDYDAPDRSWELDLKNLVEHIEKKTPLLGDLVSARYALERAREAYRANGFASLPCSV
jgi:predicted dehydrogenase